jgi:nitroreductase
MAEFYDVVRAQRACRSFAARDVDDELVAQLLWAATRAPSAENRQPWAFVVVRDDATRAALADLTRRAWEEGGREHSVGRLSDHLLAEVEHGARDGLAGAPVMVVVCGDANRGHAASMPASVFPAIQNLLLAATSEGLGSVLTTLALVHAGEVATLLELPDGVRPMAVIPLGWPVTPPRQGRRRPLAEVAHRDRYGRGW